MGLIGRHNGRKWFSRGRGEAWKILTALEYRWNNRRKSMITGVEIWNTFCNSGLPNGSGYFVTPQRSWDSKYFTIPKTIDQRHKLFERYSYWRSMIQQTGRASISLRVGQFTGKNEIPSPHSFARFEETLLYILFIYLSPFSLSLSLFIFH